MKKLLGVSIAAMLAVSPMMANATTKSASDLAASGVTTNTDIATTSYVAGAYDAIATQHNAVVADIAVADGNHVLAADSIGTNVNALDTKMGTISGTTKNVNAQATLSANIQTLDTAMGSKAQLTSTKGVLNTEANRADLVTAVKAINDALADSNTASTVAEHNYIGKTSNSSTTVSGALTAVDSAAHTNANAIATMNTKVIPLYTTWGNPSAVDYTTSIASLKDASNQTADATPALPVPTANQ